MHLLERAYDNIHVYYKNKNINKNHKNNHLLFLFNTVNADGLSNYSEQKYGMCKAIK